MVSESELVFEACKQKVVLLIRRLRTLIDCLEVEPVPKGEMVRSVELGKPYRF